MKSYHPNKRIYSFGVLNVSTEPIRLICFTKCDSSSRVYTWETAGEGKQRWNFKIPTKCYSKACWPCFICTFHKIAFLPGKSTFWPCSKGWRGMLWNSLQSVPHYPHTLRVHTCLVQSKAKQGEGCGALNSCDGEQDLLAHCEQIELDIAPYPFVKYNFSDRCHYPNTRISNFEVTYLFLMK